MNTATKSQIGLLQHTLGINEHHREPHRNHFVASPSHHDMPDLEQLEATGLMIRGHRPGFLPGDSIVFYTTEAGRVLAITSLPEPMKPTRYEEYLRADGCAGDSFAEFICGSRLPKFEDRRAPSGQQGDRWGDQHRMYRNWPYPNEYQREVVGDWAPTKKEAKASYKAALKKRQQEQRDALRGQVGSYA